MTYLLKLIKTWYIFPVAQKMDFKWLWISNAQARLLICCALLAESRTGRRQSSLNTLCAFFCRLKCKLFDYEAELLWGSVLRAGSFDKHQFTVICGKLKGKSERTESTSVIHFIFFFSLAIQPPRMCGVLFKAEQMAQGFSLSQHGFNPEPTLQKALLVFPSSPNPRISSSAVYFMYLSQTGKSQLIKASVCIENRPKGHAHVRGFVISTPILVFVTAAIWKKIAFLATAELAIFFCMCTRKGFLE